MTSLRTSAWEATCCKYNAHHVYIKIQRYFIRYLTFFHIETMARMACTLARVIRLACIVRLARLACLHTLGRLAWLTPWLA